MSILDIFQMSIAGGMGWVLGAKVMRIFLDALGKKDPFKEES